MTLSRHLKFCFRLFTTLAALIASFAAQACCGVSLAGHRVSFGDQNNIIVWDEARHVEHFVREAIFDSNSPHFGFIAPTPSAPELSEASPDAFRTLSRLQPSEVHGDETAASMEAAPSVQVIQQVDVGGYRATTLLASDSGALAAWMKKNGYQSTAGISKWTQAYIDKGWYLTAFKVLNQEGGATTGTVRMSFKTDHPFNPYKVPEDNLHAASPATLKVYFVSNGAYGATLGESASWKAPLWQASLPSQDAATLAGQLKLASDAIPSNSHLEFFVDHNFPQAAPDDVYFSPTPLWRSQIVWAPGLVLLLGLLGWRLYRSHRTRATLAAGG